VFDSLPGEQQGLDLLVGRFALRDDVQVVDRQRLAVALLDESAADQFFFGQGLGHVVLRPHVENPQPLFLGERLAGGVGVTGCDHDFLERVGYPFGGRPVTLPIERDDAAEGAFGVGGEGVGVGVGDGVGDGRPRRVGVFDHGRRRVVELLDEVQGGVGIVVVVVRQRPGALVQLRRADDAGLLDGRVGVDGCVLVGVLPVAQVGRVVPGHESTLGELPAGVARDRHPTGSPVDRDAVVGEPPNGPGIRAELTLVEHAVFQRLAVVVLVDGDRLLGDDGAGVDRLLDDRAVLGDGVGDDVDRTAKRLRATLEGVPPGVRARKRRQQGRMDVQRRRRRLEKHRRQ